MILNRESFKQVILNSELNNRTKLLSILRDCFPTEILYVNLIMVAYDAGVVEEIKNNVLDNFTFSRIVKRIVDNYGIEKKQAEKVVYLWCDAYGTGVLAKHNQIGKESVDLQRIQQVGIDKLLDRSKKKNGDKYPKEWLQRDINLEYSYGIVDINFTLLESKDYLSVKGEVNTSRLKYDTLLCLCAYDERGKMIQYSTGCGMKSSSKDKKYKLDMGLEINKSYKLSKIRLYPMKNPAYY